MNTLQLRVTARPDLESDVVDVIIDGRDLVDRLKGLEAGFAAAEGHPAIAGAYLGLAPAEWISLPEQYGDGRAAILGCECGEVACWPFRVRIEISDAVVCWSDFVQPCRPGWTYLQLGPFTFDRRQYEAELAKVRGAVP